MLSFEIEFCNQPRLQCELNQTYLAQRYYQLLRQQYQEQPRAVFRDPQRYNLKYFDQLVDQARQVLGWDWRHHSYDLSVTTRLHKDLEQYLAQGYENIPEQHDELMHELHFALHAIESGSRRNSWLQIEWFNQRGFDLPADQYPAKLDLDFGDIRLQNPHVGHHPLYLYQQQDSINIRQTCRFHDRVTPGINLVIHRMHQTGQFDWNHYLNWFQTHAPDFVDLHGEQRLRQYTGHPVIGRVVNLDDLRTVLQAPYLEFYRLIFI